MKRIGTEFTASSPHFGKALSPRVLLKLLNPLSYTRENIDRYIPKAIDFKNKTGFSFEDINSRLMVLVAYYIPQGLISIYYQQNPYETWARNALAFAGSIVLTSLAKSPTFGFGRISNLLMFPQNVKNYFSSYKIPKEQKQAYMAMKEPLKKLDPNQKVWQTTLKYRIAEWFEKVSPKLKGLVTYRNKVFNTIIKPLRLEENYLDLLEKHGIDVAQLGFKFDPNSKLSKAEQQIEAMRHTFFWSKLDNNMRQELYAAKNELYAQLKGKTQLNSIEINRHKQQIKSLEKDLETQVFSEETKASMKNQLVRLKEQIKPTLKHASRAAAEKEYRDLNKLLKLLFATQFVNSSLTAVLFTLIVGIYMQALVFKYVSPLDRKLTPRTLKKPPLPTAPPRNPILPKPAFANPFNKTQTLNTGGRAYAFR